MPARDPNDQLFTPTKWTPPGRIALAVAVNVSDAGKPRMYRVSFSLPPVTLAPKNGTGEPGGQTLFYNLYLYKTFFTYQELSYGATLAWLLFGITLVITLLLFALSRRWVYYAGER